MNATPLDTSRTQRFVDALFNNAVAALAAPKRRRIVRNDGVAITRSRGRFGGESPGYDFGNKYSVPAIVENGAVKRLT